MKESLAILCIFILIIQVDFGSSAHGSWQKKSGHPRTCNKPPETGMCRAHIERWYYDPEAEECKKFVWGGCGGNLNRFFTQEHCEKICMAGTFNATTRSKVCPELECPTPLKCLGGYQKDKDGCDLCKCACPRTGCRMYCEYGREVDENECVLCKCKKVPDCREINCLMECPYGKKKDDKGCELCQCVTKEEVCGPQKTCAMHCPEGFMKDRRGCDFCRCKSAAFARRHCRALKCTNECAYGRAKDRSGCPTCTCNTSPIATTELPPDIDCEHGAPIALCAMYCPHGFKKNPFGCPTCHCADPPSIALLPVRVSALCSTLKCRKGCEFGYKVDSKGCEICACRSNPACPNIEASCRLYCPHGFAKDDDECEICRCAEAAAVVLPAHHDD